MVKLLVPEPFNFMSNLSVFGDTRTHVGARHALIAPDGHVPSVSFDMAVNIFNYQPGAHLPFVETHIMEHGLLMLEGKGVYRLEDSWYPVAEGDCIWMAAYCPQWFVAMGKTRASYLYYKNVNRPAFA